MPRRKPRDFALGLCFVAGFVLAPPAHAQRETPTERTPDVHSLTGAISATPLAAISSMGGDGFMDDAKSGLVEMGIGARYSFRPLRHLELGLSAWYHFFHDTRPEKHHDYAHEVEIPLHVGGMVQIGKTVELVILGQVGFVHAWFPDQGSGYFSGPTLRASGFEVGPEIDLLVQLTEALDLFVGARGVMQFLSATNGVSYLEQVGIVGGMVSFAGGLRVHW